MAEIKNIDCRYSFGRFVTESTVIALPEDMCDDEKQEILQNRGSNTIRPVKEYIDTFLDPRKVNILDPSKPDFVESKDINCILEEIDITRDDY